MKMSSGSKFFITLTTANALAVSKICHRSYSATSDPHGHDLRRSRLGSGRSRM